MFFGSRPHYNPYTQRNTHQSNDALKLEAALLSDLLIFYLIEVTHKHQEAIKKETYKLVLKNIDLIQKFSDCRYFEQIVTSRFQIVETEEKI